jgi:hypothetical protein
MIIFGTLVKCAKTRSTPVFPPVFRRCHFKSGFSADQPPRLTANFRGDVETSQFYLFQRGINPAAALQRFSSATVSCSDIFLYVSVFAESPNCARAKGKK